MLLGQAGIKGILDNPSDMNSKEEHPIDLNLEIHSDYEATSIII